jgi:hypothetical protein
MIVQTRILVIIILITSILTQDPYHCKWGKRTDPDYGYAPPKYKLNMDLNYTAKWQEVVTDFKESILAIITETLNKHHIPRYIADRIPYTIIEYYHLSYAQEIKAIAELLNVPIGSVFLYNFFYEGEAYCTSLIAQSSNGQIIHGRNLDFEPTPLLTQMFFDADVFKNGSLLYKATMIPGCIGVPMGQKPDLFAISPDQRNLRDDERPVDEFIGKIENLLEFLWRQDMNMGYQVRLTLENATSYTEAVQMLASAHLAAPVYYIVSGVSKNEGSVITMNRNSVAHIAKLDVDNGIWFLAQSNYDRDIPDPTDDNRRTAAENRLKDIGQDNVSKANIMSEVLSLYPTFNRITISSSVYCTQESFFNTTVWYYSL